LVRECVVYVHLVWNSITKNVLKNREML